MNSYSLSHLRGRALEQAYDRVASDGAASTAMQIAHLGELDHQRYYLEAGCRSMFRYCVDRKGLSEDVAVQWIRTARVARAHPRIFELLAERRLTVSAVWLLARHLTSANAAELLTAAERRSIKQVRLLIAQRFGRQSRLGPLPAESGRSPDSPVTSRASSGDSPVASRVEGDDSPVTLRVTEADAPNLAWGGAPLGAPPRRARLEPIGPGLFELVAELGQETHDQLVASRELLGHAVPSGSLAEVLERAIALQHAQLRKRRCGATDRPRVRAAKPGGHGASGASKPRPANPRHVPSAVRDAVWERDGGQCTFVGTGGHRCGSRDALELDHIEPVARGGQSTVANLRLMCRAHNQYVAEQTFGRDVVQGRREAAKRRRTEERLRKAAERERTEARKREIARQCEELGEALRNLGYHGDDLRRALAYCAERADASPEERLRHALGCMAPKARRELPSASLPDRTSGACDGDGTIRGAIASGEGGASSANIAC